jgi:rhamnogalacturonan hydrolase
MGSSLALVRNLDIIAPDASSQFSSATTGGHMVVIENAQDVEFYSANSAGGFQGHGYECRNAGPRFVRIIKSTSWSLHDLIFVDSPEFHIVIDNSVQGEIYNLAIRGADIGGSDGIDVTGTNVWVHDVEVTNRDECVTVKSPSSNILVERSTSIGSWGLACVDTSGSLVQPVWWISHRQSWRGDRDLQRAWLPTPICALY